MKIRENYTCPLEIVHGIAYMIEHGRRELLEQKGIVLPDLIPTKK